MRNFLCLVCVAGAIYTTRAAKREAVEKAAESARGAEAATAVGAAKKDKPLSLDAMIP